MKDPVSRYCIAVPDGSVSSTTKPVSSKATQPMLPPCRVCADQATGYHYGVNTCEACKVRHISICIDILYLVCELLNYSEVKN